MSKETDDERWHADPNGKNMGSTQASVVHTDDLLRVISGISEGLLLIEKTVTKAQPMAEVWTVRFHTHCCGRTSVVCTCAYIARI